MPEQPQAFVQQAEQAAIPNAVLIELLQAVLQQGKPFWFQAPGFSMSPFIKDGDTITLSPLAEASPQVGEVLAFLRPGSGKLVVHRLVGWQGERFLLRGDNSGEASEWIPASSILGRVTSVQRGGQAVRLGLGVERRIIATLSRRGLLQPVLRWLYPLIRPMIRRYRS